LFVVALFTTAPQTARAQWPPDSLVNVKVLPKDMPVRQVVGVMRGFAGGLGVRCTHCHVGENSQDLASIDFVSDEKPAKRKAREMLRMVRTINDEILADLPERSDPPIEVTCATCHHGVTKPQSIQDVLTLKAEEEGADAAIDEYKRLREEYYGSYSYDFREFVLANVAESVARGGDSPGAVRILEYNLELHPQSVTTYFTMAQVHQAAGNTDGAIQALERALEIDPDNGFFKQQLQRLRGN
jgi:tetratricopeptide (TPR) repeat protein